MRTNLIAATVAAAALLGSQSAALAQGASGLLFTPNSAAYANQAVSPWVQPFGQERVRTTQPFYDYYTGGSHRVVISPRPGQQQ